MTDYMDAIIEWVCSRDLPLLTIFFGTFLSLNSLFYCVMKHCLSSSMYVSFRNKSDLCLHPLLLWYALFVRCVVTAPNLRGVKTPWPRRPLRRPEVSPRRWVQGPLGSHRCSRRFRVNPIQNETDVYRCHTAALTDLRHLQVVGVGCGPDLYAGSGHAPTSSARPRIPNRARAPGHVLKEKEG